MENLAKGRSRFPERQLVRVAGPEPCSPRRAFVSAELLERRPACEVTTFVGRVDGSPAWAAWSERRERRGRCPRVRGVPHVDRQIRLVALFVGQVIEGAAQLLGERASCEAETHVRVPDADRALDELGRSRPFEALLELADRPVER